MSRAALLLTVLLAACEWNSPGTADAQQSTDDGKRPPRPDADTDGAGGPTGHLLLTEVCLTPAGSEFVEFTNPTTDPVDLSTYYLSDNGNYWKLPAGVPTVGVSDFIVQFKAGSMIAPGAVVTVAIGTAALFNTAFGMQPTYSVADGTVTKTTVNGTAALTDTGEIVALFAWDGQADLVSDVDIMLAGAPTATNGIVTKSGVTQGASKYATDANTIANQAAAPGTGKSTKRTALEDGHETQDGTGNGITGDDETSEDTSMTWDTTFTAPTPGAIPTF